MILELALFTQLARACAPQVAVETLAAVARTESGFEALAIHDNTSGRSYRPATQAEAVAVATQLVAVQGHSADLGLMQVNTANLPRLNLTIADAFDPCRSLAAAQRVLTGSFLRPTFAGDEQAALRQALSRYNSGDATRGIANGYVQRVQASAEIIVPALRLRGDVGAGITPEGRPGSDPATSATQLQASPLAGLPVPSWDVYGQARASREHTGNMRVPSPATPAFAAPVSGGPAGQAIADARPVRLRTIPFPADNRSTR